MSSNDEKPQPSRTPNRTVSSPNSNVQIQDLPRFVSPFPGPGPPFPGYPGSNWQDLPLYLSHGLLPQLGMEMFSTALFHSLQNSSMYSPMSLMQQPPFNSSIFPVNDLVKISPNSIKSESKTNETPFNSNSDQFPSPCLDKFPKHTSSSGGHFKSNPLHEYHTAKRDTEVSKSAENLPLALLKKSNDFSPVLISDEGSNHSTDNKLSGDKKNTTNFVGQLEKKDKSPEEQKLSEKKNFFSPVDMSNSTSENNFAPLTSNIQPHTTSVVPTSEDAQVFTKTDKEKTENESETKTTEQSLRPSIALPPRKRLTRNPDDISDQSHSTTSSIYNTQYTPSKTVDAPPFDNHQSSIFRSCWKKFSAKMNNNAPSSFRSMHSMSGKPLYDCRHFFQKMSAKDACKSGLMGKFYLSNTSFYRRNKYQTRKEQTEKEGPISPRVTRSQARQKKTTEEVNSLEPQEPPPIRKSNRKKTSNSRYDAPDIVTPGSKARKSRGSKKSSQVTEGCAEDLKTDEGKKEGEDSVANTTLTTTSSDKTESLQTSIANLDLATETTTTFFTLATTNINKQPAIIATSQLTSTLTTVASSDDMRRLENCDRKSTSSGLSTCSGDISLDTDTQIILPPKFRHTKKKSYLPFATEEVKISDSSNEGKGVAETESAPKPTASILSSPLVSIELPKTTTSQPEMTGSSNQIPLADSIKQPGAIITTTITTSITTSLSSVTSSVVKPLSTIQTFKVETKADVFFTEPVQPSKLSLLTSTAVPLKLKVISSIATINNDYIAPVREIKLDDPSNKDTGVSRGFVSNLEEKKDEEVNSRKNEVVKDEIEKNSTTLQQPVTKNDESNNYNNIQISKGFTNKDDQGLVTITKEKEDSFRKSEDIKEVNNIGQPTNQENNIFDSQQDNKTSTKIVKQIPGLVLTENDPTELKLKIDLSKVAEHHKIMSTYAPSKKEERGKDVGKEDKKSHKKSKTIKVLLSSKDQNETEKVDGGEVKLEAVGKEVQHDTVVRDVESDKQTDMSITNDLKANKQEVFNDIDSRLKNDESNMSINENVIEKDNKNQYNLNLEIELNEAKISEAKKKKKRGRKGKKKLSTETDVTQQLTNNENILMEADETKSSKKKLKTKVGAYDEKSNETEKTQKTAQIIETSTLNDIVQKAKYTPEEDILPLRIDITTSGLQCSQPSPHDTVSSHSSSYKKLDVYDWNLNEDEGEKLDEIPRFRQNRNKPMISPPKKGVTDQYSLEGTSNQSKPNIVLNKFEKVEADAEVGDKFKINSNLTALNEDTSPNKKEVRKKRKKKKEDGTRQTKKIKIQRQRPQEALRLFDPLKLKETDNISPIKTEASLPVGVGIVTGVSKGKRDTLSVKFKLRKIGCEWISVNKGKSGEVVKVEMQERNKHKKVKQSSKHSDRTSSIFVPDSIAQGFVCNDPQLKQAFLDKILLSDFFKTQFPDVENQPPPIKPDITFNLTENPDEIEVVLLTKDVFFIPSDLEKEFNKLTISKSPKPHHPSSSHHNTSTTPNNYQHTARTTNININIQKNNSYSINSSDNIYAENNLPKNKSINASGNKESKINSKESKDKILSNSQGFENLFHLDLFDNDNDPIPEITTTKNSILKGNNNYYNGGDCGDYNSSLSLFEDSLCHFCEHDDDFVNSFSNQIINVN